MFQDYLSKIKTTLDVPVLYAVLYARYSSDMQRSESIDAQVRAIRLFAQQHGIVIVKEYIDEAQTAKNDKRDAFQQMFKDAAKATGWQIVLVHKLDRFSRNRDDSRNYKVRLRISKKYLISVTEQLDDSPESIILESVIEGMAEYYSKNLSREVMKGMKENALKATFCGGIPPLGYDIDPITKKMVINEFEAQAVRLIFNRFLEGVGYSSIIHELNEGGYKTKKNNSFGKNSLYEILKNEKYTGVYTYNKRSKYNEFTGKRNSRIFKPEEEIIKVEDAVPVIIPRYEFDKVQEIFLSRKKRYTHNNKEEYLLTGKMVCGVCGTAYVGSRVAKVGKPKYIYYACSRRHRDAGIHCKNGYVHRDYVDNAVFRIICDYIMQFDEDMLDRIYQQYLEQTGTSCIPEPDVLRKELSKIDREISRITNVISVSNMKALLGKLNSLEQQKESITERINALKEVQYSQLSRAEMVMLLDEAKQRLREKSLPLLKQLIDLVVKKIIVNQDEVVVYFNFSNKELKQKIYA